MCLLFVAKFYITKKFILDKTQKLQKIGFFLLDDYWKIASLGMNAKDYYIDRNSFSIMSD